MNKTIRKFLLVSAFIIQAGTFKTFAQAPNQFSYQAVIRDANGNILESKPVNIRISILQGSTIGNSIFLEEHTDSTNTNGLVSLQIGSKVNFNIDWSQGPFFIKTELKNIGEANYVDYGTTQMLSVPYALYAEKSGSSSVPGPKGDKGDKGDTGSQGLPGKDGVDGKNGLDGKEGLPGAQGPKGDKGDKGDIGSQGLPGKDGVDGKNGLDGKEGIPGAQGPKGDKGDKGDTGSQGLPGKDGVDGKNGLDGKDGLPGAQGAKGDKGDKGDTGSQGLPGKDGVDGKNGLDGKEGLPGAQGPKGDKGDKGDTGSQGLPGKDGVDGKNGLDGKDGAQGPQGLPGKDGVDGSVFNSFYFQNNQVVGAPQPSIEFNSNGGNLTDLSSITMIRITNFAWRKVDFGGYVSGISGWANSLLNNSIQISDPLNSSNYAVYKVSTVTYNSEKEVFDLGLSNVVSSNGSIASQSVVNLSCNMIGLKGDKGDVGLQGPVGKDGAQGPVGPQGLPGKDGKVEFQNLKVSGSGDTLYLTNGNYVIIPGLSAANPIKNNSSSNTVTDIDGNIYKTVVIGSQTWMAEDLKVTSLNDGTKIPEINLKSEWINTNSIAWSMNNVQCSSSSKLYNYYVVNSGKICPNGWHVPSFDEWFGSNGLKTYITTFYSNQTNNAGGLLKVTGIDKWLNPNSGANNLTSFDGKPTGGRDLNGDFFDCGSKSIYHTSNIFGGGEAHYVQLSFDSTDLVRISPYRGDASETWKMGTAIRCVKN
jgi:uncharacterized protein (TIGR02145 family)